MSKFVTAVISVLITLLSVLIGGVLFANMKGYNNVFEWMANWNVIERYSDETPKDEVVDDSIVEDSSTEDTSDAIEEDTETETSDFVVSAC